MVYAERCLNFIPISRKWPWPSTYDVIKGRRLFFSNHFHVSTIISQKRHALEQLFKTDLQNWPSAFNWWRRDDAIVVTWPAFLIRNTWRIGTFRVQHGVTKTGSSNNSAHRQHRNAIPNWKLGFPPTASTFRSSRNMIDNRNVSNSTWRDENRK